jgi:hypothetical protein
VKLIIRRANFSGLRRSTEGSLVRYASQHYFRNLLPYLKKDLHYFINKMFQRRPGLRAAVWTAEATGKISTCCTNNAGRQNQRDFGYSTVQRSAAKKIRSWLVRQKDVEESLSLRPLAAVLFAPTRTDLIYYGTLIELEQCQVKSKSSGAVSENGPKSLSRIDIDVRGKGLFKPDHLHHLIAKKECSMPVLS